MISFDIKNPPPPKKKKKKWGIFGGKRDLKNLTDDFCFPLSESFRKNKRMY